VATRADELVSFVPRLTLEWLRDDPEQLWREVDGTLAFVDISGFTAMSEQLSSRGRAGAEEVTEVMNATFAALLEAAYAEGGGLLKFGGDALLLLYDGDEHARRAARAAFTMRRTLRGIGRVRTAAGTVNLKMHAGLHSGRFSFFLVGDSHRELLVTGPAATTTVEMEAASEAGEILLSATTAEQIEAAALGDQKGPGFLLQAAPAAPGGSLMPRPDILGIPLEVAVPKPLRAQLLEVGPLEGEHRHAAIAFVRFSGLDDVIATEGPDAAADALDALVRKIQTAADAHNVTFLESDVDRDGGRIILVAGAPQTHGDDEERMLRTVRAAVDSGLPLPVHVGVSQGRVFAGQVGATFRRTYTVLGDTAALAARLMARAEEDAIFVAADAFGRGGGAFDGVELEPFMVKGKQEPVHAFALGDLHAETQQPDHTGRLPFVDRERERAVLGAAVAPVRMGFGTLVELIGEPGIGKSRLAQELETNCADMAKLNTRCDQYEATTPYHPFRPLLRSLLDVELNGGGAHNRTVLAERLATIDDDLVPWAPLLGAPLDVEVESTPEVDDLDPAFWRARLHGVMGKLLGELLDSPTLLLFEDVHWMDDASSELLRFLGTQLPTRPWLTCTTRRPGDDGFAAANGTPPLPALTLRLEAIPEDDAKILVRAAAGDRALSEEELSALLQRGAGNPLFLQELVSPDEASDQLPETVEALVSTRIDRLAPGDRALLRWASVMGISFPGDLIADVLEDDPSVAAGSEAWDRLVEFVERDPNVAGAFRFRHALIRDAAYEGLSFKRRRELHGRVAEALERRNGESELLSLHYQRAERRPETWRHSLVAGRRAQAKWANLEASEFYRRALEAAPEVPELGDADVAVVWEALGDCLDLAGRLEGAVEAYAAARALVPAGLPQHVELMHKEGDGREKMGQYSDALTWYGRALAAAQDVEDEETRAHLRVSLNLSYATVLFRQGAFDECIRRCLEIVEEAIATDDQLQVGRAYMMLHNAYNTLGSPERIAFRGLALPIFEELGDLRRQAVVLNNLGIDAYFEGDWDKALDVYTRSRDLFDRIGDVSSVAMADNNVGEILADRGQIDEAEAMFEPVRQTADASGNRGLGTIARLNLGRSAARAGRFDDADALIREACDAFSEMNAESFALEAEARLAEADALRGAAPAALARAQAILECTPTAAVRAIALRVQGVSLLQLGRVDEAGTALEQGVAVAREAGLLYEVALALDLLGRAESRELFEQLRVDRVARPPLPAD
jgi:class 3 adenylate cyclase/tetratricopeptide (TPR) repeat protein